MIDKIWFDWQNRNSASASSFSGGSVSHANQGDDDEFPTGGPPYLSVSTDQSHSKDSSLFDYVIAQLNSTIPADGLFPEVTIRDVMNTTGDYLCYVYI